MDRSARLIVVGFCALACHACSLIVDDAGDVGGPRGPYLQSATPTSITIRWRTEESTRGVVRYGATPSALSAVAEEPAGHSDHTVVVSGLSPATRYYYSIGTTTATIAGDDSYFFTTAPEAGADTPVRIWAFGDSGTADEGQRQVRDSFRAFNADAPPDVWLMLGDNAYEEGTDGEYQRAVFDVYPGILRQAPLWPTLGNHDTYSRDEHFEPPYFRIFTLPERGEAGGVASGTEHYYSFDHANIHFICLDSNDVLLKPGKRMTAWLREDLAATTQEWLIAYWHHAPYSKGSHDSDEEQGMAIMRTFILPILEEGGVDLVLGGHSHDYERSFLLDGHYGDSDTLVPAMILDAGSGEDPEPYLKSASPHAGAVYVVAGSGGNLSERGEVDHPAMFISFARRGSLVIDVEAERLRARFLSAAGTVDDDFTIVKSPTVSYRRR
jgi:acid phosphatase type 7